MLEDVTPYLLTYLLTYLHLALLSGYIIQVIELWDDPCEFVHELYMAEI